VVIANPNGFGCDGCSFINTSKLTMVSGRSEISDGVIRLVLPYTTPPSCDVPMTFELLSIAP
jgi:hypothetical protein